MIVNGQRIEVKTSSKFAGFNESGRSPFWKFNIHRRGVLNEKCDFYVLIFKDLSVTGDLRYGMMRAPIGKLTVQFTVEKLIENQFLFKTFDSFIEG